MNIPERFQVSRSTVFLDRFMNLFIRFGGLLVVVAVFAIFIFIGWQILPLFRGAQVGTPTVLATGITNKAPIEALGVDEWVRCPFVADATGRISFFQISEKDKQLRLTPLEVAAPHWPSGFTPTVVRYNAEGQNLAVGSRDGRVTLANLEYTRVGEGADFTVSPKWSESPPLSLGPAGSPILDLNVGGDKNAQVVVATVKGAKGPEVWLRAVKVNRSLGGDAETVIGPAVPLSSFLKGTPAIILLKKQGDGLLTVSSNGVVQYLLIQEDGIQEYQTFTPFEGAKDPRVTTAEFIFGDVSVSFTGEDGSHHIWSLYAHTDKNNQRYFGRTKILKPVSGGTHFASHSIRNKTLLLLGKEELSLRYSTTEDTRWHGKTPVPLELAHIAPKNDHIVAIGKDRQLVIWDMKDRHPEVSFKAFFGQLWYEGSDKPKYEWQSTGGTDDFEPKLSLIPLIIGTLKGTFYALLFAIPIALMAGLYASQFLHPTMKGWVKPTMEIMASLPSVVLGFLAALLLAPLLETRIPSLLLILVFAPSVALLFGNFWAGLPVATRARIKPGHEFLYLAPLFMGAVVGGWVLGPTLEKLMFTVKDAQGLVTPDFRLWFTQVTGLTFDQRNSLVVGFIMGFAVMPILFTIAEDAFSNVPESLRSGSLALGASRWQTAIYVVLPTAAAGIFSAIMVAFGRAVGETMIVVMATGNTPVMDMNLFSGMRTLSANIAVELPEAPEGGTLYRTLFLGAMVLFLMTFMLNTLAEILRQRLRDKYKNV